MAPSPSPPYSFGQVTPNQPFSPTLRPKRRHLAADALEAVLGVLGLQRRGHVVAQEGSHLVDPRPLGRIEADVHER